MFQIELYSITDDENEYKTIFISFAKIRAEGPLKTKCRLIPGWLIDKVLVFFKDEDPLLQSVIVY